MTKQRNTQAEEVDGPRDALARHASSAEATSVRAMSHAARRRAAFLGWVGLCLVLLCASGVVLRKTLDAVAARREHGVRALQLSALQRELDAALARPVVVASEEPCTLVGRVAAEVLGKAEIAACSATREPSPESTSVQHTPLLQHDRVIVQLTCSSLREVHQLLLAMQKERGVAVRRVELAPAETGTAVTLELSVVSSPQLPASLAGQ